MTLRLTVAAAALVLAAGCGATKTATKTVTVRTDGAAKTVGPPGEQLLFGYISALKPAGTAYELRFDPALLLTGVTANVAQAEDQGTTCRLSACPPVANDSLVVNEGHRLLTYIVPTDAKVTALTKGVTGTPITVAQLSGIVAGKNPLGHKLWEGLDTGVWIRVKIDTVLAIDQQYHP